MELPRQDPDQLLRAIRNDASTKKSGKLELSISSDTVLKAGDTMLALGSNRNLQRCFHT